MRLSSGVRATIIQNLTYFLISDFYLFSNAYLYG